MKSRVHFLLKSHCNLMIQKHLVNFTIVNEARLKLSQVEIIIMIVQAHGFRKYLTWWFNNYRKSLAIILIIIFTNLTIITRIIRARCEVYKIKGG